MERAQNTVYERVEKADSCCDRDSLHEENDLSDKDLTKLTSATMVFSHIQKLADQIKETKPEETTEKYLTKEFLELISVRIAQERFMRSNFQHLLTPESLFQLAKLHHCYQNKPSGNFNPTDVNINVGVQVGSQDSHNLTS
ncbi:hypothetical protein CDAR_21621 [Caerostris darwini]|uniref:Uncharacterized protein n=1 Tax=Caerostris darwini TaxID=1538125 RepID=A0AAV4VZC8_9ARAC|nr:hypothetical protein CDAR_21621 [Caerostris darwini]